MKFFIAIVTALVLTACGSGTSGDSADGESNDDSHSLNTAQLVDSVKDLPVCDKDSDGALIYVKADKKFRACTSEKWSVINLKGDAGKEGPKGKDGESIVSTKTYLCGPSTEDLDTTADGINTMRLSTFTEMSDGTYFASCLSERVQVSPINFTDTSSDSRFWKVDHDAAFPYAACITVYGSAKFYPETMSVNYENDDATVIETVECELE